MDDGWAGVWNVVAKVGCCCVGDLKIDWERCVDGDADAAGVLYSNQFGSVGGELHIAEGERFREMWFAWTVIGALALVLEERGGDGGDAASVVLEKGTMVYWRLGDFFLEMDRHMLGMDCGVAADVAIPGEACWGGTEGKSLVNQGNGSIIWDLELTLKPCSSL